MRVPGADGDGEVRGAGGGEATLASARRCATGAVPTTADRRGDEVDGEDGTVRTYPPGTPVGIRTARAAVVRPASTGRQVGGGGAGGPRMGGPAAA